MAISLIRVLSSGALELTSIQSRAGPPTRQASDGSARGVAGVDGEHRAGHVRGLTRTQPQARLGDLFRLAEPAKQAEDGSELLFGEAGRLERTADHRRVDRPRTDRVDADPVRGVLERS